MTTPENLPSSLDAIIPHPLSLQPGEGFFELNPATRITYADKASASLAAYLAELLRPATGYPLDTCLGSPQAGEIHLKLVEQDVELGAEGYELRITAAGIELAAYQPAGLFRGLQSLRQLLPAEIENPTPQPGPWRIPAVTIRDNPRFEWRGAMLDVARHFFSVAEVKRFIDLLALYKINRLHLHLTDDQGWRIMIHSWPELARYGGETAVDGDPGGYYTQEDYVEIVAYASSRYMLVVPEIDLPGHTNAALASYAELNCSGKAPERYTGTRVGFSTLCTSKELTYQFLEDVIGELAVLTPGPYIHIGGDEAQSTREEDYIAFISRVQEIVERNGKILVGWDEVSTANLRPPYIAQFWQGKSASRALNTGARLILSPSTKTYVDMQYTPETPLGQHWAAYIEVKDAYDWDPVTFLSGVGEKDVLGVEAPLWTETIRSMTDIEFMVFPRLPGIAEVGWSQQQDRDWADFRLRLATHAARWDALQIHFYRSPQVPWP